MLCCNGYMKYGTRYNKNYYSRFQENLGIRYSLKNFKTATEAEEYGKKVVDRYFRLKRLVEFSNLARG